MKFVRIDIAEEEGMYHITYPFGEGKLFIVIGRDGKTPTLWRMQQPTTTSFPLPIIDAAIPGSGNMMITASTWSSVIRAVPWVILTCKGSAKQRSGIRVFRLAHRRYGR